MTPVRTRYVRAILVAAAAAVAVAVIGALVTELGPWYQALAKPDWKPPDAAFGPIWTLIFGLSAIAGVLAWNGAAGGTGRGRILALFAVNAVLNVLWSVLFFRLHRPDWSLAQVAVLWLSVAALMVGIAPHSRAGPWLLLPYLAWVSIAAYLNLEIVRLNGPFGLGAQ